MEQQATSLPPAALSREAGELLWRSYDRERAVLTVAFPSPKTEDRWQLTPQGWVGHIPLTPEIHFVLQPKVPVQNLFRMLEYAYRLQSFRFLEGDVTSDILVDFYERLAHVLAQRVLQRAHRGFHRAYLPYDETLPYARGRLDLRRQRPWDPQFDCHFEEHTADIADNQILAWTLHRIAQSSLCSPRVQPVVRKAYRTLRGMVTPTPFRPQACIDRLYNRLNEDYQPLHGLCRFFLEHSGPGHRCGERTMIPFLVNMARLYELFVAQWLQAHLPQPWILRAQERVTVRANTAGGDDILRFDIDLVLYDEAGTARYVLDTKYKSGERVSQADINQVVTYARLRECREAILVYPEFPGRPLDANVGGVRVRTLRFGLDGNLAATGNSFLDDLLCESG